MSLVFWGALSFGFLGSLHCVGMCGGLVGALTMGSQKKWNWGLLIYQVGRITTYAILGLVAGLLGSGLDKLGGGKFQIATAVLIGVLMAGFGLNMMGLIPDPLVRMSASLIRFLKIGKRSAALAQNPTIFGWFTVGLFNGLLPCGLVYAALSLALSVDNVYAGIGVMGMFGLGTIPAMTVAPGVMRLLRPAMRGNVLRVVGALMIAYGVFTGLRGSNILPFMKKHNMHNHSELRYVNPQSEVCTTDEHSGHKN